MNTIIKRNNLDKQLVKSAFGKKSDNFGKEFFYPDVTLTNIENDLKWIGLDEAANILNKVLRGVFADIYIDNVNELTGEFDEAQWEADAADFSAGVAKLSDIEEELDVLQAEGQKLALDEAFGARSGLEEGKTAEDYSFEELQKFPLTPEADKLARDIVAVNKKIKPLRAQKASIEAKYKIRAEVRKAKKAAKEAAAKANTGASQPVAA